MTSDLITTGMVARALGISAERVRQIERAGYLPAMRTANGIRLFRADDVKEFRKQREERRATR